MGQQPGMMHLDTAGLMSPEQHYNQMGGNMSNRISTGQNSLYPRKGGRKSRPISAYPVAGHQGSSVGGFLGLNSISESIESTQASHLSRYTMSLAKNNQSRKQYIPTNIQTFEKEKLYEEKIALKKQRNDTQTQNVQLKTQIKSLELDLKKKDAMISNLTQELKHAHIP